MSLSVGTTKRPWKGVEAPIDHTWRRCEGDATYFSGGDLLDAQQRIEVIWLLDRNLS